MPVIFANEQEEMDYYANKALDYDAIVNDTALSSVIANANEHQAKKPNMRTLWEEVSEATLSWRGKHEHPLRLELVQIAGICINMIRQIDAGEEFKP